MSHSLRPHELTVAHQAPLSMGFSRQEYWSGLPFPSPTGKYRLRVFGYFFKIALCMFTEGKIVDFGGDIFTKFTNSVI